MTILIFDRDFVFRIRYTVYTVTVYVEYYKNTALKLTKCLCVLNLKSVLIELLHIAWLNLSHWAAWVQINKFLMIIIPFFFLLSTVESRIFSTPALQDLEDPSDYGKATLQTF